jgi:hypothetical protein
MAAAPRPTNDVQRLDALRAYDILDTAPEAAFDAITELAANICDVPIALVTLVDEDRQWFKSNCGLSGTESTPRNVAFCAYAIMSSELFEVPDAALDPRFAHNPLVTGEPFIRFYAGVPLIDPQGMALGTLCVIDRKPRLLTRAQRTTLERSAQAIAGLIAMRTRRSQADAELLSFFDTAVTQANERAAQLDGLLDLAHCFSDAEPQSIRGFALEAARQLCRADVAAVIDGSWDQKAWPSAGSSNTASALIGRGSDADQSILVARGTEAPFTRSERTVLEIITTMMALKLSHYAVAR